MASVKGFAPWKPRAATAERLKEVLAVINEGKDDWPLSQRYWLYRLMSVYKWKKFDEYNASHYRKANGNKKPPRTPYNLNHILDRGRRAGIIPWEAIESTRGRRMDPSQSDSPEELADAIESIVRYEQFGRQAGQDCLVVLWVETEGLAPSLAPTAHEYGAPVLVGKGFDVIGSKYAFAQSVAQYGRVLVPHAGDLDKSGWDVMESLFADLSAFVEDLGGQVGIERITLTEEQVATYKLVGTPVAAGLNAGNHGSGFPSSVECQLEAMKISDIRAIIRAAFEKHLDMDLLHQRIAMEAEQREEALRIVIARGR